MMVKKIVNQFRVILNRCVNALLRPVWKRRVLLYKKPLTWATKIGPETEYLVVVKTFILIPPFAETASFNLHIYFLGRSTGTLSIIPTLFRSQKWVHKMGWQRTSFLDLLTTRGVSKTQVFEELTVFYDGKWTDFKEAKR